MNCGSQKRDPKETTLGLQWNCLTDTLSYKTRPSIYHLPTMRNIYKVLANQYDPLGYLTPFTTCAKFIVQDLWKQERGWDDVIKTDNLLKHGKYGSWNCKISQTFNFLAVIEPLYKHRHLRIPYAFVL